jgi:hypothetical protein
MFQWLGEGVACLIAVMHVPADVRLGWSGGPGIETKTSGSVVTAGLMLGL